MLTTPKVSGLCWWQVWVITGDKQETAINIAIACKLIHNPDSLLICNANSREEASKRLAELADKLHQTYAPIGGPKRATSDKGAPRCAPPLLGLCSLSQSC